MHTYLTEAFIRGYDAGMREVPTVQRFEALDAQIIFCGTVPREYNTQEINAYKEGVREALGADTQFLIQSGEGQ